MSVQRKFAERNNNVTVLTPTTDSDLLVDPIYSQTINVDVRNATVNSGTYSFRIVYDTTIAAKYPGLEFTVFFDSYDSPDVNNNYVEVNTSDEDDTIKSNYHFATPGHTRVMSVTLKSNGRIFSIISSGNSPWTGGD